jgi:uncharacterized protein (TIGR00369 family)
MSRAKGNLPRMLADEEVAKETLHSVLGIEVDEHADGFVKGHVPVTGRVKQELGLVHGGVYAAMAEGFSSLGTWLARGQDGMIVSGQQNDTSFLRPVTQGTVHAECRVRHRGRTTWIWDCELSDDDGRLCALVRMTVAVRPAPAPPDAGAP